MPNPYGAPEISVQAVSEKLAQDEDFILLDVRELHELDRAQLTHRQVNVLPLSELAQKQLAALPAVVQDKTAEIVVMCHHGNRSGQVTAWLINQGWTNVLNMAGGIDTFARDIDPKIGFY